MTQQTTQIQLKRGTAAALAAVNPVLARGEPCLEIDTGKVKHGDGTTAWNDLAYANPALEVIDGGALTTAFPPPQGFSPLSLPGLHLWLDASDDATVDIVNGRVSRWLDKSAQHSDVVQSLKTNRPINTNTIKNQRVVSFNGTAAELRGDLSTSATAFTLFLVFKPNTNNTVDDHIVSTDAVGLCVAAGGGAYGLKIDDQYVGVQHVADNTPVQYSVQYADGLITTKLNGAFESSEYATIPAGSVLSLGADVDFSRAFNGDIAEVVFYNRALTAQEYKQVKAYLHIKWVDEPGLLDHLQGFWPLNEIDGRRYDVSDYAHDLLVGEAASYSSDVASTAGKISNAALFDGMSYLEANISTPIQSVSLWVKLKPAAQTNQDIYEIIGQWVAGGGSWRIIHDVTNGGLIADISQTRLLTNVNIADDQWHHVAGVFDNNTKHYKLYVDGGLVGDTLVPITNLLAGFNLRVASVSLSTVSDLIGAVDSVGAWDRELTASDIATLYNGGYGYEDLSSLVLYFLGNGDWADLSHWKLADGITPAPRLPSNTDIARVQASATNSGPPPVVQLLFCSGNSTFNVEVTVLVRAVFNNVFNDGTIHGNATFNDGSRNRGTIDGGATFNATTYNTGTVTGGATFVNASNSLSGVVAGNAVFYNNARNDGGTIAGNATFNDTTCNFGVVQGDATFKYLNADQNGAVIDVTNYANGHVNGRSIDAQGNTITCWIFNTTINSGTVTGDAVFNGSSQNGNIVTGDAVFNDNSSNNGTVNGTVTCNTTGACTPK